MWQSLCRNIPQQKTKTFLCVYLFTYSSKNQNVLIHDQPQHDPDPLFYREVAMADLPSQHAEEVETLGCILDLPDPRETMPRSSTSVLGLDNKKGQQELRPRVPSSMLPLSSHIKDAFDKFEHDFLASNLPEGKCIKPPFSTAKWYKVGQPCYEDKIQELNTDFSKISISTKLSGAPMDKVPKPVLKELEYQGMQNLSTINFIAAFVKTFSSCNSTLEKCQHCLKSSFYCEKYTNHFLTIAICRSHPTHWPTLRNILSYLKKPVSECGLGSPPIVM